jgi:hypothetical protein
VLGDIAKRDFGDKNRLIPCILPRIRIRDFERFSRSSNRQMNKLRVFNLGGRFDSPAGTIGASNSPGQSF